MRDPWLWYQLFKAVDIKKNKQHGGSNPKDLEKQVRKDSGLSKREMGELKRMIKKDRRRFVGLSDEQIVSEVRLSYKNRQRTITLDRSHSPNSRDSLCFDQLNLKL